MKYLFLLLFISLNVYGATNFTKCGQYEIYGELKENIPLKGYDFVVNSGSMSEYKFHLTSEQVRKLISNLGYSLKLEVSLLKLAPEYEGVISKISKVDLAVPDPAHFTKANGFKLIKLEKCQ